MLVAVDDVDSRLVVVEVPADFDPLPPHAAVANSSTATPVVPTRRNLIEPPGSTRSRAWPDSRHRPGTRVAEYGDRGVDDRGGQGGDGGEPHVWGGGRPDLEPPHLGGGSPTPLATEHVHPPAHRRRDRIGQTLGKLSERSDGARRRVEHLNGPDGTTRRRSTDDVDVGAERRDGRVPHRHRQVPEQREARAVRRCERRRVNARAVVAADEERTGPDRRRREVRAWIGSWPTTRELPSAPKACTAAVSLLLPPPKTIGAPATNAPAVSCTATPSAPAR